MKMELETLKLDKDLLRVNNFLIKEKNSKAIKSLNKILDEDPTNEEAWLLLGIAKRRTGNYLDAIDCFRTATDLKSSLLEAWGLLAITYMDNHNFIEAKATMERAAEKNPNNKKIQFYKENLIRVYQKFGPFF
ncbi:MAG: tetratricopeptide repeat protein [Promethearchaeota archaeon]|nr:MAG: tetratricopeptide repeat protein [Candidatus Lokiarchaeota archaeon]